MLVFLIGFMGAGKTTLGKAVAARLNYSFIDLDETIEQQHCSIPELFAHHGEPGFRKIEQQVLFQTVQTLKRQNQDAVIACGGGSPCYEQNLEFMKSQGFVIYLYVSPEILCERLLGTPVGTRPMLPYRDPSQLLPHICNLLEKRRPFYEAAHWVC